MFAIGSSLREARVRSGFDLAEAEAATKIRSKYLKALEDERFDTLPAQTYVKGFLRSYAEFLGLDGQLYVDEYSSRYGGEDDGYLSPARQRPSPAHRRFESRILLLGLLGIAAATALVVIAWRWGGAEAGNVPNLQTRDAPAAAAPAVTAPAVAPPVTLTIGAVAGDSWIAVRKGSGQGEILFEGTLERGRTRVFTGKRLWLNVGSPENLAARLNKRAVKLPKRAAPVVLVVTKKGVQRAS